ncbi:hypothetical protein ACFWJT_02495 [Streptomyces sp. NPDC127069]|uniref:hypothetical protein n=1 Tax=Streptomyces sp. NPDC127069 TaxID=3347128 RepID=UPI00364DB695
MAASLFHPVSEGETLVSGGSGGKRRLLVVAVVFSRTTHRPRSLAWFRVLPRSTSRTSWLSMPSRCCTPECVGESLVEVALESVFVVAELGGTAVAVGELEADHGVQVAGDDAVPPGDFDA